MKASLFNLFSRPIDTASALGKPILSTTAELGARAGRQLGEILAAGEPRYRAFISYSHRDMDFARWLHRAIENYRVPRALVGTQGENGVVPARLRPVFRDEDELASAAELGPKLQGALAASGALIVICSPASAGSQWVDKEIRTFKSLNPGKPVFAVIAAGIPGSETEDCFPRPLLYALGEDGELDLATPLEPLAPDAQKLERKVVKLKLIAGMLGVPYATLYRRDRVRARKFAVAIGTFAVALIAVLSALSIFALSAAKEARQERNAAIAARELAEKNRDLAERKAWLAQTMATEYRRQSDELAEKGATCSPPR